MKQVFSFRFIAAALIVLSSVLVVPTIAQDESTPDVIMVTNTPAVALPVVTVEPTPVVEPTPAPEPSILDSLDFREFTPWLGAILLAIVIGFFYVAGKVVVQLAAGIPQFAWEGVRAGANSGLAELKKYVELTPNTLDDAAFAELEKKVLQLEAEVDALRRAPAAILSSQN